MDKLDDQKSGFLLRNIAYNDFLICHIPSPRMAKIRNGNRWDAGS